MDLHKLDMKTYLKDFVEDKIKERMMQFKTEESKIMETEPVNTDRALNEPIAEENSVVIPRFENFLFTPDKQKQEEGLMDSLINSRTEERQINSIDHESVNLFNQSV